MFVLLIVMFIIAGIILVLLTAHNMMDGKKCYGEIFILAVYAFISILTFNAPVIRKYADLSSAEKGMLIFACIVFTFMTVVYIVKFIQDNNKRKRK